MTHTSNSEILIKKRIEEMSVSTLLEIDHINSELEKKWSTHTCSRKVGFPLAV
jgi:hypothetical protein